VLPPYMRMRNQLDKPERYVRSWPKSRAWQGPQKRSPLQNTSANLDILFMDEQKQPESIISGEMSAAEKTLLRKQDLRIVPISAGIYFLCFLDRANIGNARQCQLSPFNRTRWWSVGTLMNRPLNYDSELQQQP
jgi:hypothetical protein